MIYYPTSEVLGMPPPTEYGRLAEFSLTPFHTLYTWGYEAATPLLKDFVEPYGIRKQVRMDNQSRNGMLKAKDAHHQKN